MKDEDEENFKQADECRICNKKYKKTHKSVRDHCHVHCTVTGKYRGSAHEVCNLDFKLTEAIPIKCFVSHCPPSREGGSVGRAKKKE